LLYEYKSTCFTSTKVQILTKSCKYAQRTQTELEAALARSNVERESEELQAYISVKQQ
jgi:glutaredoxin